MKFFKPLFRSALLLALVISTSCTFLHAQSSELGIRVDNLYSASSNRTSRLGNVARQESYTKIDLGLFFQLNKANHYLRFGAGIQAFNTQSELNDDFRGGFFGSTESKSSGNNLTFEIGKTWEFLQIFRVQLGFETSLAQEWRSLDRETLPLFDSNNGTPLGLQITESKPGGRTMLFGKGVLRVDARLGKRFHVGTGIMYGGGLQFQKSAYDHTITITDPGGIQQDQELTNLTRDAFLFKRTNLAAPFINISYSFGNNN